MKKMLILTLIFISCNNSKTEDKEPATTLDPTKSTDTRDVNPNDTSKMADTTGAYKKMSDSIRQ